MIDLLRVGVIGIGIASFALSAGSMYYFWQRQVSKKLLTHVIRVNLTYYAFVLYGIYEVVLRLGRDGLTFNTPAIAVIFCLALYAQVPLYKYERAMARDAQ